MLRRVSGVLDILGLYGLWAILAALLVLALYQLHATLIYIGLLMVKNPSTRPAGWNTGTIYGLSRFLFLVLGAVWLVAVSLLERYLREGKQEGRLRTRVVRLIATVGAIYVISYAVMYLLS
jgi:nitrogen fixation/metabolism regulation signal transduction histidine kinase